MAVSIKEIKQAVLNNPSEIKYMFELPNVDKRMLTRVISSMIPYRIGIEFECFCSLSHHLVKRSDNSDKKVQHILGLYDYKEDYYKESRKNISNGELNEIRISILNYKSLSKLYNAIKLIKRYCKIPSEKGGIHIHVDISKMIENKNYLSGVLQQLILDDLSKILSIVGGYTGTYNRRKVGIKTKATYVNISNKNSIEFRVCSLTFEYKTIIRWIIEFSKLVKKYNHIISQGEHSELYKLALGKSRNYNDKSNWVTGTVRELDGSMYSDVLSQIVPDEQYVRLTTDDLFTNTNYHISVNNSSTQSTVTLNSL